MIRRALRIICLIAAASILTLFSVPALCAPSKGDPQRSLCITQPWMASMASFIAGSTVKIYPMTQWGADGRLRKLRVPSSRMSIIALDPKDASARGLQIGAPDLHLLYVNFPVRDIQRGSLSFDPSVLPFLSQRLLIVMSELDPDSYPFYQRRLAEFQSRMESTIEVGKSLIGGAKLLDLTGSTGPWIKGAAPETVRPPDELWNAWMGSTRTGELKLALEEADRRGLRIVTDAWTPAIVMKNIGTRDHIAIPLPESAAFDLFEYLHEIYMTIWNELYNGSQRPPRS